MEKVVGSRVFAMESSDARHVRLYGFGVYEGHFPPAEAVGWIAETIREQGRTNPRIRLDSGQVVYGCECWWGAEESLRVPEGVEIVPVDIDEARRAATAAESAAPCPCHSECGVACDRPRKHHGGCAR